MGRFPSVKGYFPPDDVPQVCGIIPQEMPKLADTASEVAREVYRRMRDKNLGQKALALKAGVNETYVQIGRAHV